MKILFAVNYPLSWAKGGFTVQVEQTRTALQKAGVEVEWVDYAGFSHQTADVVHFWGSPSSEPMWNAARAMGLKTVVTFLAPKGMVDTSLGAVAEKIVRRGLVGVLGASRLFARMGIGMDAADAWILLNSAERQYVNFMYGWPFRKCHVIPNGVEDCFFDHTPLSERLDGLLYPSYICPRKNQVEVAQIAKKEKICVYFVGGAQGESPEYFEQFKRELDGTYAVWLGEITSPHELATLYRRSLGTFLASDYDNLPLILLESLASSRPVMGPASVPVRSHFGDAISYCHSAKANAFPGQLREFYKFCKGGRKQDFPVLSWSEVAKQIIDVYESVLKRAL